MNCRASSRMYPTSIQLCSSLTPFLKPRYLSWISHSASQVAESVRLFTTKTLTPTTNYITPLLTLSNARMAFPIPSSCAFAIFALRMMTSCRNARKCPPFSRAMAIPHLLQTAWDRASSVTRQEALVRRVHENKGRIPPVLTYHPLTSRVKHILLNNFNILPTEPATAMIFPAPPVIAHRRDLSLWDVLVHTSDRSQTEIPRTFACRHPRCRTCLYTSPNIYVCGPKSSTPIRERFTSKSENIVYCISFRQCPQLYIRETGRTLRERFDEHLRSVQKTWVVSRSPSTLTPPVILYQTLL